VKSSIQKITIIGTGNVASHLCDAFHQKGIKITLIISKSIDNAQKLAERYNTLASDKIENIDPESCVLICVNDNSIKTIIDQIPASISIAYTSGSVKLNELPDRENIGVIYPLQTFTKDEALDISTIPFFIESKNDIFQSELIGLAQLISKSVQIANSEFREKLHICGVFVNNFTTHIVQLAQEYAKNNEIDFNLLMPLLNETVHKLNKIPAIKAQTGPAKRGDDKIISKHISQLTEDSKTVYTVLSSSIKKTHSND
jgi:predicted short-subunit dehydrogenase-like oxidoreductase (DUF2520 family)